MSFLTALRPYWHPVIRSGAVTDRPVAVRLLDEPVVLWRSGQNIVALEDLCIHRGAALSMGKLREGNIECPYHGFQYAPNGRCVHIPSLASGERISEKARVKKYHATERYGAIWIAMEEPKYDIFEFPEFEDPEFRTFLMGPMDWNASAPRVIENNYDYSHLPFLHEGRLGSQDVPTQMPALPVNERVGNEYRYVLEGQEPNWAKVHQPGGPAKVRFRYYNRLILPLGTHARVHALDSDHEDQESDEAYLFVMAVSPTSENESRTWLWVSRNYSFEIPDLEFERWEANTLEQDLAVLESQRPQLIPTDLKEELLLPNEAHHVQYRRWLASIGID